MVLTPTRPSTRLTRPAWLLVATLPAYIAFVVLSATLLRPRVELGSAELTPDQIGELGPGWVAIALLWVLPPVLAAVGLAGIARGLPRTRLTRAVPYLGGLVTVLAVAYVAVHLLGIGAGTLTWGESPLFTTGFVLSLLIGWAGVHPASLLVLGTLVRAGIARRTATVVGVIYVLYWAVELLIYLPVLLGPGDLAGADAGLPPFLLGFFWAAVGGALLRTGVPSAE